MKFEKRIQPVTWDEALQQKIMTFWEARRVTFTETNGHGLRGRRGSWLGNLTSFDMSKLVATVTVTRVGADEVSCVLDVNTLFQQITQWNQAYWLLELATLESYLLRNDLREADWKEFHAGNKQAAIAWALSRGILGQVKPPDQ